MLVGNDVSNSDFGIVLHDLSKNDGTIWDIPYEIDVTNTDLYPLVLLNSSAPPDTTTDIGTDTETDPDTSTDPGTDNFRILDPLVVIVSFFILFLVGNATVILLRRRTDPDDDNDDDDEGIFGDFQSGPPPTQNKRKNRKKFSILDEKPYKYDPDEPHL